MPVPNTGRPGNPRRSDFFSSVRPIGLRTSSCQPEADRRDNSGKNRDTHCVGPRSDRGPEQQAPADRQAKPSEHTDRSAPVPSDGNRQNVEHHQREAGIEYDFDNRGIEEVGKREHEWHDVKRLGNLHAFPSGPHWRRFGYSRAHECGHTYWRRDGAVLSKPEDD